MTGLKRSSTSIGSPAQSSAGCLAQQRSAAAVEHAADDLVLGIVIRCAGIFVEVEAGEPPHALPNRSSSDRTALQVEDRQPFAVVQPVEHDRKFFVVHAVAGKGDFVRLGRGVLPQMRLPTLACTSAARSSAPSECRMRPVDCNTRWHRPDRHRPAGALTHSRKPALVEILRSKKTRQAAAFARNNSRFLQSPDGRRRGVYNLQDGIGRSGGNRRCQNSSMNGEANGRSDSW